jgi:ATP-dependent DNA helicase RecQ
MTQERQTDIYIPPTVFEERQQQYVSKLHAMLEYADQTRFCREQVLLTYFGETDSAPCGHCDVCLSQSKV